MEYKLWNALAYEVTNILIDYDARWEMNKWIKLIRQNCSQDWVEWKTECVLKIVDRQMDVMQKVMEAENKIKYVDPIVIEHPADDSKAQQLLGGTLEIKAPWFDPKVTKE